MTTQTDKPSVPPAGPLRPLHTRKSAWKLGWPAKPAVPTGNAQPCKPTLPAQG